ncbi:MAG: glycosyltransferase, partial [Lutispora sp.]
MNENKICFISCVNNQQLYNEALYYINQLEVPKGYEIGCISIENANSITAGYSAAMKASDAKYKVYLHQDAYITNKSFIEDILNTFNSNDKIGMLGVAGAKIIPTNAIWWESKEKYGKVYDSHTGQIDLISFDEVLGTYETVQAIDGLIMITQYDIPWREDIFDGWHFYDLSQSVEFIKAGYEVVVPRQEKPWVIHDSGIANMENGYEEYRKVFMNKYLCAKENKKIFLDRDYPKTSIIIETCNNLEHIKICIENVIKYTQKDTYEIIIIDNNSTDGTVEWLKQQPNIKLILNDEILGFSKAYNQGIKAAKGGNDILLLNCNAIVTPNWLRNLKTCLYSEENIGATGLVSNSSSYYQTIQVNYTNLVEMIAFAEKTNISDSSKWEQRVKLEGHCILIKRTVFNKISLLDERYDTEDCGFADLSFSIQDAGYKLMLCNDVFIHYLDTKNIYYKYNSQLLSNLTKKDLERFKGKWGFNPVYSTYIRNDIINLIQTSENKQINVLEIGCACGATLLKIKTLFKKAEVYGIELDGAPAKFAKIFADVRLEDVEKSMLSYKEEFFDYIIFADVLEHLYDPWKVLANIKKYLKVNGKILASIPNVMHYSIISELINGRWT